MNLCLIYLTEWVREYYGYIAYPQRWVMGIDGFTHPPDSGAIGRFRIRASRDKPDKDMPEYDTRSTTALTTERAENQHIGFAKPGDGEDKQ